MRPSGLFKCIRKSMQNVVRVGVGLSVKTLYAVNRHLCCQWLYNIQIRAELQACQGSLAQWGCLLHAGWVRVHTGKYKTSSFRDKNAFTTIGTWFSQHTNLLCQPDFRCQHSLTPIYSLSTFCLSPITLFTSILMLLCISLSVCCLSCVSIHCLPATVLFTPCSHFTSFITARLMRERRTQHSPSGGNCSSSFSTGSLGMMFLDGWTGNTKLLQCTVCSRQHPSSGGGQIWSVIVCNMGES